MNLGTHGAADGEPEPASGYVARYEDYANEGGEAQHERLGPVRVCRGESHGSSELVVDVVDLVVEPLAVQTAVEPVAQVVFHEHVHQELHRHLPRRRKRQPCPDPRDLMDRYTVTSKEMNKKVNILLAKDLYVCVHARTLTTG